MSQDQQMLDEILKNVGGIQNVETAMNCQTRLRLKLKDASLADEAKVQEIPGVFGTVVNGQSFQVVVGPGKSSKLGSAAKAMLADSEDAGSDSKAADPNSKATEVDTSNASDDIDATVKANKKKYKKTSPVSVFLKHVGNIFVPIIPAFIGCGLLLAISELCGVFVPGFAESDFGVLLSVVSGMVFTILPIIVGFNTMNEFGGSGVLGAVLGGILNLNKTINGIVLFSIGGYEAELIAGRGGIFTVLTLCILAAYFEKFLRKIIPEILDTFLTPLLVIICMSAVGFVVFMPICGLLSDAISIAVNWVITTCPWAAGLITMFYLPLVVGGIHHGLIAINTQLVAESGVTPLLPVTCMSGAGQVGAAFFVFLKTKNKRIKKTALNGLPVGMLGVGEPLLYGVTVPLGRPFIASCLGGAVAGSVVACLGVVAKVPELAGLQLALVCNSPLLYLVGILSGYVAGFIFAAILGFEDPEE